MARRRRARCAAWLSFGLLGALLVTRRGRQVNSPDYLHCIITNTRDDLGLTEPRDLELKSARPAELLQFLPHDEARGRAGLIIMRGGIIFIDI